MSILMLGQGLSVFPLCTKSKCSGYITLNRKRAVSRLSWYSPFYVFGFANYEKAKAWKGSEDQLQIEVQQNRHKGLLFSLTIYLESHIEYAPQVLFYDDCPI